MTYKVRISERATAEFRGIRRYLSEYDKKIALKYATRLGQSIEAIGKNPTVWPYFFLTGHPFRSKLFMIGGASYGIIYEIHQTEEAVNILRIWHSAQDPDDFEF
jgi:plasmid stabilization system protein ParE